MLQFVEGARYDLAARGDRVGQFLLAHLSDQSPIVRMRRKVEQLSSHSLTHAQERLVGDFVEGPDELAGEFCGASLSDRRIGLEHRSERIDAQSHNRSAGQSLNRYWRRAVDHEREAHDFPVAGIADRDLAAVWRSHIDPQQPVQHDDRAAPLVVPIDGAARRHVDTESIGQKALGGRDRQCGKKARRDGFRLRAVALFRVVLQLLSSPFGDPTTLAHRGMDVKRRNVMTRFEYRIERVPVSREEPRLLQLVERLAELGRQGWSVASVDLTPHPSYGAEPVTVLLERELVQSVSA